MQQTLWRRRPSWRYAVALPPNPTPGAHTSSVTTRIGSSLGTTPVQSAVLIALGSCRGVRCSAGTMHPQPHEAAQTPISAGAHPFDAASPQHAALSEHWQRAGTWTHSSDAGAPAGSNKCQMKVQMSRIRTRPILNSIVRRDRNRQGSQTAPATRSRSPIPKPP